jgi:hypothetical protein
MKAFASKQRESLSMVPHQSEGHEPQLEVDRSLLKDSFRGWIHSVASFTSHRALPVPSVSRVQRLTALDVSRVNQATIREGESHCVWPPSVIQEFNKAEVITTSRVGHYVLQDANLNRVEHKQRNRSHPRSTALQMLAERD